MYLPVLGCDDDVIHGSFFPQHLLKSVEKTVFFVLTNILLICHRINTAVGRIICQLAPHV